MPAILVLVLFFVADYSFAFVNSTDISLLITALIAFVILTLILLVRYLLRRKDLSFAGSYIKFLLDNSADAIIMCDCDGEIAAFNQRMVELTGFHREELNEMKLQELIISEYDSEDTKNWCMRSDGEIVVVVHKLRKRNGDTVTCELRSAAYKKRSNTMFITSITDITSRRTWEEKLMESEQRFRQMFEDVPAVKYVFDPKNLQVVMANKAACTFYGFDEEGLIGLRLPDFDVADEKFIRNRVDMVQSGQSTRFQAMHKLKNAEVRDVEIFCGPVKMKGGEYIYAIVTDITDRIRLRDELRTQKQFLQTIIDYVTPMLKVTGLEGEIVLANRSLLDFYDLKDVDEMRDIYSSICDAEYLEQSRQADEEVIRTGEPIHGVTETISYNGEAYHFITNRTPWRGVQGEIRGVLSASTDITDIVKAEKQLMLDEKRFQTLFELSQLTYESEKSLLDYALDAIVDMTESKIGYIYLYEEETETLTLHSWSRDVMKLCTVMDPQTMYNLHDTGLWGEAIRQKKPIITNDYDTEKIFKKGIPEGHVPIKRHMNVPVFDRGRIVALAGVGNKEDEYTEQDVIQIQLLMEGTWQIVLRRRIEDELRAKTKELEVLNLELEERVVSEIERRRSGEQMLIQQSKMAAMGEMVGVIAHQWRQPLNVVALLAQLLQEEQSFNKLSQESLDEKVGRILDQVDFMSETVDEFKDFFKPSKEKTLFKICDAVSQVIVMVHPQTKSNAINVNFKSMCEQTGKHSRVLGYPNEFKQVLMNMLMNSKDAILSRREQSKERFQGEINIDLSRDEGIVSLVITDNGTGITDEIKDKLFQAYESTKGSEGTGIGLYMAKMIIEDKMNGTITGENIEKGARFAVKLNEHDAVSGIPHN